MKTGSLHESVVFYDNENRGSHSGLLSNDNNNNLFISVIKVQQDYNIAWIGAYSGNMKALMSRVKADSNIYEKFNQI